MALLTLILGLIPLALGLAGLAVSIDLVPTEMGRLYAESGVIFLSSSFVVLAVAAMIHRMDRISAPRTRAAPAPAPVAVPPPAEAPAAAEDDDINLNRSGHLPSLHAVEEALAEPEAGPHVIGRYSAGGAQYMVYSDGTIEAESDEGGLRFASMAEFKAYVAARKG
jgi:hypothetical protein